MKKIIFFAAVLFSTASFSQTTRFSKFNSSSDLKNEFPNVKSNEKNSYYIRLLKLSEVERLSNDSEFKRFSRPVLISLVEEMYGKDDEDNSYDEETKNILTQTISKVDNQIAAKQKIESEDLLKIYNPGGIYSGLEVVDLSSEGNKIYFTRTNGLAMGTHSYTYKVKKNKLKKVRTFTHSK